MATNRLDIILAANASQLQQAITTARAEVRSLGQQSAATGMETSQAFEATSAAVNELGDSLGKAIVRQQQAAEAAREAAAAEAAAAAAAERHKKAEEDKANALQFIVEETDLLDGLAAARAKAAQEAANEAAAARNAAVSEKDVGQALGSVGSKIAEAGASNVAMAFAGIAAGGTFLTKTLLDASSQMEQYRATLTAVTHSSSAAAESLRKMSDFAGNAPFDLSSIVSAGVHLKALQLDVDQVLPRMGNLAAVFGENITEAEGYAKAMTGSADGLQQLSDKYGITHAQLIKFGAAHDAQNNILTTGAANLQKLQTALTAYVDANYGDAMAKQMQTLAGQLTNLKDSITTLAASTGDQLAPAAKAVVGGLTDMVKAVGSLPSWVKAGAAAALVFGTVLATVTAALAGLVVTGAVVGPLLVTIGAAMAGPVAGFLAVAAAVLALREHLLTLDEAARLEGEAMEQASKRAVKLADAHRGDWANKSAKDLHALGVTTRDMVDAQQALGDRIEDTRKREDLSAEQKAKLIAGYQKEKAALHEAAASLGTYEAALKSATVSYAEASRRLTQAQADLAAGHTGMAEVVAKARERLESATNDLSTGGATKENLENVAAAEKDFYGLLEQLRLADVKGVEAAAQAEVQVAQQRVQAIQLVLHAREQAGQATLADQKRVTEATIQALDEERNAALARIDNEQAEAARRGENINHFAAQRKAIEVQHTNAVKAELQKQVDAEKEAQARHLQIVQQAKQHEIEALDRYGRALERWRRYGNDTSEEEAASAKRRMLLEKEAETARYSAEYKKAGTKEDQAAANAQHRANEAKIEENYANQVNAIDDRKAQRKGERARMEAENTQLAIEGVDRELEALERRRDKGESVEASIQANLQKRHDLQVALAGQQAKADTATEYDPAKQGLIEQKRQSVVANADSELNAKREKAHDDEMKRVADQLKSQSELTKSKIEALTLQIQEAQQAGKSLQEVNALIERRNKLTREQADLDAKSATARASTSTETATQKAVVDQEGANQRKKADLDTGMNRAGATISVDAQGNRVITPGTGGVANGASVSVDAQGNRVLTPGEGVGGGGATIGVDAQGNRTITPGSGASAPTAAAATAHASSGASSGTPQASPAAAPAGGAAGAGSSMNVNGLTINAQSVTINTSAVSGGGTSSSNQPAAADAGGIQSAPNSSMSTSFVGDFMGGMGSSAMKRDAFFAGSQ